MFNASRPAVTLTGSIGKDAGSPVVEDARAAAVYIDDLDAVALKEGTVDRPEDEQDQEVIKDDAVQNW